MFKRKFSYTPRTKLGEKISEKLDGKTYAPFSGIKWDVFYVVSFAIFAYISAFVKGSVVWFVLDTIFLVAASITLGININGGEEKK